MGYNKGYNMELIKNIKNFFKKQEVEEEVKEEVRIVLKVRLTHEEYVKLENSLERVACDHATTEIEAGYKLGIQAVLKKLRDGFVAG